MPNTFYINQLHSLLFLLQNLRLRMIGINIFRKITKNSNNPYQFNPSTIFFEDNLFTIWREVSNDGDRQLFLQINCPGNKESKLYDLGEKIKAINASIKWIGDARLFARAGQLQIVFDTGSIQENPNRIFICILDKEQVSITSIKEVIKLDGRNAIEKNWNFFCEGEILYSIYSHQPLTILKLEKETNDFLYFQTLITHSYNLRSNCKIMGEIRGTSTPILAGNVFISPTHSSVITKKGLVYYSHFFIFESNFPFLPVSFSRSPVKYGFATMILRPRIKLNQGVHRVEFPSGVFKVKKKLVVGFGVNDFKVGVKIMRLSRVLSQRNSIEF